MSRPEVTITHTERIFPATPPPSERTVPLSLLDATTANFGLTSAIWLFDVPSSPNLDLANHLRTSLATTLTSYPQWSGRCTSITTPPPTTPPPHTSRYGRIHVHFGTPLDPGVEFTTATSPCTLATLHPSLRPTTHPLWTRPPTPLSPFSPATKIAHTLTPALPSAIDSPLLQPPLLAIQLTTLSCGSYVLAAKTAHPMSDIASLTRLVRDWGRVSAALVSGLPAPVLDPVFEPSLLDACAAGDINAAAPDGDILRQALRLPMHRYDWWAAGSVEGCPWGASVPDGFKGVEPVGDKMPWETWDVGSPVGNCVVHFSRGQVEVLHAAAARDGTRVSAHDAVLAHVWSCVVRAREMGDDRGPVHCDLTLGVRPALGLGEGFMGSPILLVDVEMPAADVAAAAAGGEGSGLGPVARRIRETLDEVNNREALAAHLHGLAFEKSPQRIWQAFLGSRHILVTTWARAGIYEVDFGIGSTVRYVDDVVPDMDGMVLIKEAPPPPGRGEGIGKPAWTDHGVDVSVHLRREDMERLLRDPELLPQM